MKKTEVGWGDGHLKIERAMLERKDILNDILMEQNGLLLRIVLALEEWNNID